MIQLSAGIIDVFEMVMSQAPYSLAVAVDDAAGEDYRDQVVREFSTSPANPCDPLMATRLKQLYPSFAALKANLPRIMAAWGRVPTCIAFTETTRAEFGKVAASSGPGRNVTEIAAKHIAQQANRFHRERGGADMAHRRLNLPALIDSPPSGGMR